MSKNPPTNFVVRRHSIAERLFCLLPSRFASVEACRVGQDYTTFSRIQLRNPFKTNK